jgi:hypothetical protein
MAGQKREARLARAFAQMSRPSTPWSSKKKGVDARAFATPKRLRPRRRVKPGHDEPEGRIIK